jgi:hypothetical protein
VIDAAVAIGKRQHLFLSLLPSFITYSTAKYSKVQQSTAKYSKVQQSTGTFLKQAIHRSGKFRPVVCDFFYFGF